MNFPALVLSNHRTRIDWMYVGWCYAYFLNCTSKFKVILKNSLKNIPFYGWAMQLLMFIFLTRDRNKDVHHITNTIDYLMEFEKNPCLLLFPEGTDLSDSNIEKANQYARDCVSAGASVELYKPRQYVLFPKVTGALEVIKHLLPKCAGSSLVIHDVTIAYKDYYPGKRTTDYGIMMGEFPPEIHLHVERVVMDTRERDNMSPDEFDSKITQVCMVYI